MVMVMVMVMVAKVMETGGEDREHLCNCNED